MFTKLIEIILEFWEDLKFWTIIPVFEMALVLHFGKSHRVLGPGIHWKWPFADQIHNHIVIPTTMGTGVQSVITKDGKQIAVKSVIKYTIYDIQMFVEQIYDQADALVDVTQGAIMEIINARTYEECLDAEGLSNSLAIKVRRDVKKYGIAIEAVTLTDFADTPSYRIFTDGDISL